VSRPKSPCNRRANARNEKGGGSPQDTTADASTGSAGGHFHQGSGYRLISRGLFTAPEKAKLLIGKACLLKGSDGSFRLRLVGKDTDDDKAISHGHLFSPFLRFTCGSIHCDSLNSPKPS
jgi:hypothetical protein